MMMMMMMNCHDNHHDASSASPAVIMIIMSTHLLHLKSGLTGHLKRILKKIRTMTKKMMMNTNLHDIHHDADDDDDELT